MIGHSSRSAVKSLPGWRLLATARNTASAFHLCQGPSAIVLESQAPHRRRIPLDYRRVYAPRNTQDCCVCTFPAHLERCERDKVQKQTHTNLRVSLREFFLMRRRGSTSHDFVTAALRRWLQTRLPVGPAPKPATISSLGTLRDWLPVETSALPPNMRRQQEPPRSCPKRRSSRLVSSVFSWFEKTA